MIAREAERHRLHRDLHDGLGLTLGAAVLALDAIRRALPPGAEQASEMVDGVKASIRETMGEVRRVIDSSEKKPRASRERTPPLHPSSRTQAEPQ